MEYEVKKLEKILKRKYQTIKVYLSRAEFSHIKKITINKKPFLQNITLEDIKALNLLVDSRHWYRSKRIKDEYTGKN